MVHKKGLIFELFLDRDGKFSTVVAAKLSRVSQVYPLIYDTLPVAIGSSIV